MLNENQLRQLHDLWEKNTITDEEWQKRLDEKSLGKLQLISVFIDGDKMFTAKCKDCGECITQTVSYLKKSRLHKKFRCKTCATRIREQKKEAKIQEKENKAIFKQFKRMYPTPRNKTVVLKHAKIREIVCSYCGNKFTTTSKYHVTTCNDCKLKFAEDRRTYLILSRPHDEGITLSKLFKRDHGICYLCGKECDYSDKYTDENGNIIAGNYYPSIDHVVSIVRGGTHQWRNVKLAHRLCNSIKSKKDYIPYL